MFNLCDSLLGLPGLDYYAELDAVEAVGHPVKQLAERRWAVVPFASTPSSEIYDPMPVSEMDSQPSTPGVRPAASMAPPQTAEASVAPGHAASESGQFKE